MLTYSKLTNAGLVCGLARTSGSTALHHAVERGDVDAVSILLQHGADPTVKNDLGKCPIDYSDAFPGLRGALKRVGPFRSVRKELEEQGAKIET